MRMPRAIKGRQGRGHPPVDKHRDIDCSNCISEESICAHAKFSVTSPTHPVQQWLHYNDDIYKINVCLTGYSHETMSEEVLAMFLGYCHRPVYELTLHFCMYDLRVIVAVVVIHQLDIRTCTAQKIFLAWWRWSQYHPNVAIKDSKEFFEQCMSEYRAGVHFCIL